jgi:XTP/dITP diphosphohydrolase
MEIVLATSNLHKLREFKNMLKAFSHIDLLSLNQFSDYPIPEETGITFKENAILKAETAAKALNKWVLADDSGLVVPSLNGAPGVYSARYAGIGVTDADNRKKLLKAMHNLRDLERSAYFECAIALASPTGLKKCVTGICEGHIIDEERGNNGFGYDPLFVKNDYEKTFAELDEQTKNRISHRRKALERLMTFLETVQA